MPSKSSKPTGKAPAPSEEELEEIKAAELIEQICLLIKKLPYSVKEAEKSSKLRSVFTGPEGESVLFTFNRRFDAVFAEDCGDGYGRLPCVERGPHGMDLVTEYLQGLVPTLASISLGPVMFIKLERLQDELLKLV
jgi:hypothetical protein